MTSEGITPEIRPLPEPPSSTAPPSRPSRSQRMAGESRDQPAAPPVRGALVPPELDLVDPDAGNATDTVTLRMRKQHCDYLGGLREAISIRYGVSKRVIDEAVVVLLRQHRGDLIELVSPMSKPDKVVDVDRFLGDQ